MNLSKFWERVKDRGPQSLGSQLDRPEQLNIGDMIFAQHLLYSLPCILTCVSS